MGIQAIRYKTIYDFREHPGKECVIILYFKNEIQE